MTVTTEKVVEVKISNKVKAALVKALKEYQVHQGAGKVADVCKTRIKGNIEKLFADNGEFEALQGGVKVDGFIVRHYSPVTSRFDIKKAIAKGFITAEQIEECSKPTPGKPYMRINVPGEDDSE